MSYYAVSLELTYDLPASVGTATQNRNAGVFTKDDRYIGRAVERSGTGNAVVLVGDGNKPIGVITRFTGPSKVAVAHGPVLKMKRGPDAALTLGSAVTGATRQESAGGSAERGFVKNADTTSAATLEKSKGSVLDGGAAGTANTAATDVEVLLY